MNESIAKQIHEKAAPVVAWLRTAEEESSGEEEDEEDEVEVVYSERAGTNGLTAVTEKLPQPTEEVRERRERVRVGGGRGGLQFKSSQVSMRVLGIIFMILWHYHLCTYETISYNHVTLFLCFSIFVIIILAGWC